MAMNTLLVAIVAATVFGGSAAYTVYDRLGFEEDALKGSGALCSVGGEVGTGHGIGILRFVIQNDGADQDILLCILDHDGDKMAQRSVHVKGGSLTSYDLRTPTGAVYGEVDYGPRLDGMGRQSSQIYLCAKQAATVGFTLHAGGGIGTGIGEDSDHCTSRTSPADPQEDVRSAAIFPEDLGAMGPALGAGVGVAAMAALLVYNGGRLHFLGLLLFSRVARHKVLDQDVRQRIHDLVHADPGIHASAIQERLELAHGQALYHLHVLVREHALARVDGFGQRHFFPHGRHSPARMRALAALRQPTLHRVYSAVQARPGQAMSHVANEAGLSLSRVSRVARRLENVGLVQRRAAGREVFLTPTPATSG